MLIHKRFVPADNVGMEYLVGTTIDLSYINKTLKKNTAKEDRQSLYEIGTKVLFVSFIPSIKTYTIAPA